MIRHIYFYLVYVSLYNPYKSNKPEIVVPMIVHNPQIPNLIKTKAVEITVSLVAYGG